MSSPINGPVAAEAVLDHIERGADVIVGMTNGEPVGVIDALEANHTQLDAVRLHQMHSEHPRPSIQGEYGDHLHHVSYFLSHVTRPAYWAGQCDLVPNHFSELPHLLRTATKCSLVVAAVSPPNRHGYFSLGTNADYVAALIGKAPFFVEVNHQMPRTQGLNQIHESQVLGWCERDAPLVALPPTVPDERDRLIAEQIVERIPNDATVQIGVGGIPNAVLASLRDHRDLGIHTEALSDGVLALADRGVITGTRKALHPNKIVTTFALGTQGLYEWIHENSAVEFLPVDYVNNPRVVAQEKSFVSVNATTEVDLFGQCASETIAGRYWSSSGGQADFARGAMYSEDGQAFIVLHSTTRKGISRIRVRLTEGSVVTTLKNTVDNVVTEWGVAKLRGRSIAERARALVAIAHPDHRDALEAEAREAGIWDTRGRTPQPVN